MKYDWFDSFKSDCQEIFVSDQVDWSEQTASYETATFQTAQKILGVVKPRKTTEVSSLLKLCHRYLVSVYPVSGGKNWGYGSRVPCESNSLVLDLSQMNQITDYSEKHAYVTVQPGVTQQQLLDFLNQQGDQLWMDVTSSSNASSIIGNYLERGHGVTPIADHVSGFCNMEVVLPDGEIIRTGYGSLPSKRLAPLDRWGLGPSLDGLFSQSNLGIVTSATVWLLPKPECVESVYFQMNSVSELSAVVNALQPLKLSKVIGAGPAFVNNVRIFTGTHSYSDLNFGNGARSLKDAIDISSTAAGIPEWSGSVGFFGPKNIVAAQRDFVIGVLKNHVKVIKKISSHDETKDVITAEDKYWHRAFMSMNGKSGPLTKRPYWKKSRNQNLSFQDLDADKVGFFWFPTTIPFDGEDAVHMAFQVTQIVYGYDFEPDICFTAVRDRTLQGYMSFVFDRDNKAEEERALECNKRLVSHLAKLGYMPHRLSIDSMKLGIQLEDPVTQAIKKRIKSAFDPGQILARGRYLD